MRALLKILRPLWVRANHLQVGVHTKLNLSLTANVRRSILIVVARPLARLLIPLLPLARPFTLTLNLPLTLAPIALVLARDRALVPRIIAHVLVPRILARVLVPRTCSLVTASDLTTQDLIMALIPIPHDALNTIIRVPSKRTSWRPTHFSSRCFTRSAIHVIHVLLLLLFLVCTKPNNN